MNIHRSYFYYEEKKDDSQVEDAIRQAAEFGDGFWMIYKVLRKSGRMWNHKKVISLNGKPKNIRCDNGPEFIATDFRTGVRATR